MSSATVRPLTRCGSALPWLGFTVSWLVVGLVLLIPSYRDGHLYNAAPVLLAYLMLLFDTTGHVARYLPWIGLHLALASALTAIGWGVRLRFGAAPFTRSVVVASGLLVGLLGWAVYSYWPDGVYFDATTIRYDVSEFVGSSPDGPRRFETPDDFAARVFESGAQRGEHYLPHYIGNPAGSNELIVWGTWPEHYRLRGELEALRGRQAK